MSETARTEVSALFLKDAQEFMARCKDEGLTMAIIAVEVPSSDLARLAKSNAELREALRRMLLTEDGLQTGIDADLAVSNARRALSDEGE